MFDENKDFEKEYEDLMKADAIGRTDGDGPADVAPVVVPDGE